MATEVTIPTQDRTQDVTMFKINPNSTSVRASVMDGGRHSNVTIDIKEAMKALPADKQLFIRKFFKGMKVIALNEYNKESGVVLAESDLTDEVLNIPVEEPTPPVVE